jgi:hypothetical protein
MSKKSLTIDCSEEKEISVMEAKEKMLECIKRFEDSIVGKILTKSSKVFTNMVEKFNETFKPQKAIEMLDFAGNTDRFLIAEMNGVEVILFVGETKNTPLIINIFIRSKREFFFSSDSSPRKLFGKKLKFDFICFYDLKVQHIICEEVRLLTQSTQTKTEPILEMIRKLL